MTGLTAYFGLLAVGRLAADDVVLASGAAGAVGTAVGQIAKIRVRNPIGIAVGPEKCRMLVEDLGFTRPSTIKAETFAASCASTLP